MCTLPAQTYKSVKNSDPLTPGEGHRQERLTLGFTSLFKPLMKSSERKKRWSEGGLWRTEDCAEAAELQSGLVAAVIILMLVVKQLWQGGKASMADPLPSTALDAKLQGNTCWPSTITIIIKCSLSN